MDRTVHQDMNGTSHIIREVWSDNLEEEIEIMRDTAEQYHWLAIDTEFPGVVARPTGPFRDNRSYYYQTMRCNVNLLKVIQIGFTFSDDKGKRPPNSTWQFNFKFSVNEDLYAQDSIDFLRDCGIDFERHTSQGIDPAEFAMLMTTSGIVLNDEINWLSFHGSYDFGYLLRILSNQPLPQTEEPFFELLQTYFPSLYDIKHVLRSVNDARASSQTGLNKLAEYLDVLRVGPCHQAGSDSYVTSSTFFALVERYFTGAIAESEMNQIYGLSGKDATTRQRTPSPVNLGPPTNAPFPNQNLTLAPMPQCYDPQSNGEHFYMQPNGANKQPVFYPAECNGFIPHIQ